MTGANGNSWINTVVKWLMGVIVTCALAAGAFGIDTARTIENHEGRIRAIELERETMIKNQGDIKAILERIDKRFEIEDKLKEQQKH